VLNNRFELAHFDPRVSFLLFVGKSNERFHERAELVITTGGRDNASARLTQQRALGGVHRAETKDDTLGLTVGQTYPFDMFQAERHTVESNFRADTNLAFTNCGVIVPDIPLQ
jgi:fibro-slime domain-containing protein